MSSKNEILDTAQDFQRQEWKVSKSQVRKDNWEWGRLARSTSLCGSKHRGGKRILSGVTRLQNNSDENVGQDSERSLTTETGGYVDRKIRGKKREPQKG